MFGKWHNVWIDLPDDDLRNWAVSHVFEIKNLFLLPQQVGGLVRLNCSLD